MGNVSKTLPGVGAGADDAKPVLSTPTSREASFEAKRRRAGSASMIEDAPPGGAAFLIAAHHHDKYPTLFGRTPAPGRPVLAGSGAGHPHCG